jgi:hypothetical protein
MAKKPKTVWVGNIEVTPVTAEEHRALDRKIKKRYERLRKRYKEIRGKRVEVYLFPKFTSTVSGTWSLTFAHS